MIFLNNEIKWSFYILWFEQLNFGKINKRKNVKSGVQIFISFSRQDSDIPNPYGRIVPNENPPLEILQQIGYNLKRMSEPMQRQKFSSKRPKLVFEYLIEISYLSTVYRYNVY